MKAKTCRDCQFAVFRDYGYSDYTVEGTEFNCAKQLHLDGEFEPTFDDDKRLKYADECKGFKEGKPIDLWVEANPEKDLEGDQFKVWKLFIKNIDKKKK